MKEHATGREQDIESLRIDLPSALPAMLIHGSQSRPDAPMKRMQLSQ
jgi:hypothetical protein